LAITRPTELEKKHKDIVDQHNKSREKIAQLTKTIDSISIKEHLVCENLKKANNKLELKDSRIEQLSKELGVFQGERRATNEQLDKVQVQVEYRDLRIEQLNKELGVYQGEIGATTEQLQKVQAQIESRELRIEQLGKELEFAQSERRLAIGQLQESQEQIKSREIKINALNTQIGDVEKQLQVSSTELEHVRQLFESGQSDQEKLTGDIQSLKKEVERASKQLIKSESQLLEKDQSIEQLTIGLEKSLEAYRKVSSANQALSRTSKSIDETLNLLFASKTWWLSSKFIRLMLSPLRLGGGFTVLDELERHRAEYKTLQNKLFLPVSGPEHSFSQSKLTKGQQPKTSIVVLNRDGEKHLELFFSSFLKHHKAKLVEFVIVDHGSKDGSLEVIEKYMERLPIKLVSFTQNNSFSFSNNFALRYAIGKFVVFANNDIIFDRPVIDELVGELDDDTVGLVSLPLYYADEKDCRSGRLQHAGISFRIDEQFDFARPVNKQIVPASGEFEREQAAVTAALIACRKADFIKAGKFHEGYDYGYEDIDLCLTFKNKLNLSVVLTDKTSAIHDESSSQKKDSALALSTRRRSNIGLLRNRWGHYLEKQRLISKLTGGQWTQQPFRVGLVVTDDDPNTKAGDFFTAMELATALTSKFGWQCSLLPEVSETKDWYDIGGLDCIIVLLDKYEVSKVHNATGRVLKIAWLRNWFDRWVTHPWFNAYDLCLCSSEMACEYVTETTGKQTHLLKIATNAERFNSKRVDGGEYTSDYCFTGSYWGSPREIEGFDPHNLPYDFALYGVGWENHPQFIESYKGSLPYEELSSVYADTKILIDDANHVTKPWGSVNSRVFDALAAGVLVITNGDIGANDTFGELMPVYHSIEDLEKKVGFYMENPEERKSLAEKLHQLVVTKHTYLKRAEELKEILEKEMSGKIRIAIKLPVPRIEVINEWGDYHLGKGLAKSLSALGYSVRLDIIPDWYTKRPIPDDVVITIRGLSRYEPDDRNLNLMWQISHPDKVEDDEYEQYDHVFVASEKYATLLEQRLSTPVSPLLQCTDPERFVYSPHRAQESNIVFVGNSRKQFRPIVKDAIDAGLDLVVYGSLWEKLINKKYIAGQHIKNEDLGDFYASSGVVLNDHWETMRENGFISNRLFDAAACGAVVVSDYVEGVNEIFDGLVYVYTGGEDELLDCTQAALSEDNDRKKQRENLARKIAKDHSFDARARAIDMILVGITNKPGFQK